MKYVAPVSGLKAFTCPHCGVLARQYHFSVTNPDLGGATTYARSDPIATSICENCGKYAIWHSHQMVYPNRGNAPVPNPDMPEDVKKDYEEAASIYTQSPRGAAALLRLAIQKLSVDLGGKGKNINDDIKALVTKGLPEKVQQSLDIVRVTGNHAVHPGQINTDNPEVAGKLFVLLNVITEYMISMPKKIDDMYSELPEKDKEHIEKRDGN